MTQLRNFPVGYTIIIELFHILKNSIKVEQKIAAFSSTDLGSACLKKTIGYIG